MKKFTLIIATILISVATFAQSGKSIYNKFSDNPKVSAVYISPTMFRLMGKLPKLDMPGEDINISSVVRELEGMYIIDSENAKVNMELKAEVDKLLTNGKYELIMEAKEEGETVRLYTCGDNDIVTSFVMAAFEKDEYAFICLEGRMNRKEFESLITSSVR